MAQCESQPNSAPPAGPRLPRGLAGVTTLALVVLPWAMHAPYRDQSHVADDFEHLACVADFVNGDRSLSAYLLAPVNEHLLPAWRAWYYASWRLFGLEPAPWHAAVSLAHGFSSAMLFCVLLAYTGRWATAAFAAGLWAIAGIGNWENPLSWIPASHLTFGIAWLSASMACLTRYRSPRPRWAVAMAGCLSLSILSMSAMWVLAPVLVAQWWLLERRPDDGRRPRTAWAIAWLVPFVFLSPLALAGAMRVFDVEPMRQERFVAPALLRTPASWTLAAENLLFRDTRVSPVENPLDDDAGMPTMPVRAAVGVLLAIGALLIPGVNRRLIVLLVALAMGYSLLVQYARSSAPDEYALVMGRYAYVPTFGWCGVLGTLLAADWFFVTARRRQVLYGALVAAAPWLVWQQARTTAAAAAQFEQTTWGGRGDFRRSRELFAELATVATARGRPVRIPDVTWSCRPLQFSVRQLLTIAPPGKNGAIEVVGMSDWTADDRRDLAALLEKTANPFGATIGAALHKHAEVAEVLAALDAAAEAGTIVYLPELSISVEMPMFIGPGDAQRRDGDQDLDWAQIQLQAKLSDLTARMFPAGLPHVRIVDPGLMAGHWQATHDALGRLDRPTAHAWQAEFAKKIRGGRPPKRNREKKE